MILITPDRVAAVWDMLRQFPPISKWKLPPAEEVEFTTSARNDIHGQWSRWSNGTHIITVSVKRTGHLDTLIQTVAHEMIHAYQDQSGTSTRAEHNAEFSRLASQVCRAFGFDEKAF